MPSNRAAQTQRDIPGRGSSNLYYSVWALLWVPCALLVSYTRGSAGTAGHTPHSWDHCRVEDSLHSELDEEGVGSTSGIQLLLHHEPWQCHPDLWLDLLQHLLPRYRPPGFLGSRHGARRIGLCTVSPVYSVRWLQYRHSTGREEAIIFPV